MKKTDDFQKSTGETVTFSCAEYEKLLGQGQPLLTQNERISHLENQVELLMEALRLARYKQFGASSEKSEDTLMEQLSFLFNEAEVFSAVERMSPSWQPTSGTRSMNIPWTTSRKICPEGR